MKPPRRPRILSGVQTSGKLHLANYFGANDFAGAAVQMPELNVEVLTHFRLCFHSQSAIPRAGRWVARWNVFDR